jgi:hypothetical protein
MTFPEGMEIPPGKPIWQHRDYASLEDLLAEPAEIILWEMIST